MVALVVSCSAARRITLRMQASRTRIRITSPRMRMRTSGLTYDFQRLKNKIGATTLPLGKRLQTSKRCW
nr:MAG TPA: hypothetical protein [Caudoviricetes sp.]